VKKFTFATSSDDEFLVWFANFCLEIVEWSGVTKKIELLINFSSQNTFLFGVKLSDYHTWMQRAAS